jgi:hypothetical protein
MQTHSIQLSADQIVEESSDWPEDAVVSIPAKMTADSGRT